MTAHRAFHGIKACVFDAYGTLFDVHSPVARMSARIGEKGDALSRLWRQKQLEYTWLRSLMGAHADFWQVTGEALDYALAAHGIADPPLRAELMQLYLTLDAYPDARACLVTLKAKGFQTAILSNGSPKMLDPLVRGADLTAQFDAVLSIEEVGVYKPDKRVYQLAVDRLGTAAPAAVCFVSANTWDAQAGAHFGFQVARVDRFGAKDDNLPGRPARLIPTLAALPDLVAA